MKTTHLLKWLALLPIFAQTALAASQYKITGTCDGLPKIDVTTPPGFCVGLVTSGITFPRTIVEYAPNKFILVDMGGWAEKNGVIYKLIRDPATNKFQTIRLFGKVDRPHKVAVGPDKKIYIGEISAIFRFEPDAANPLSSIQDVVTNLPSDGRHPLTDFVFDGNTMYVNRGSKTDNCEGPNNLLPNPNTACEEADGTNPRAVIRKYVLNPANNYMPNGFTIVARGLRNSMALAVHPTSKRLYQAENARDAIDLIDPAISDKEQPKEEINLIEQGHHYGWPYCYNSNVPAPEYVNKNCSKYIAPALLLPSHVAPLGMIYYTGQMFPEFYKNAMLISYHGYREYGQKLVVVPTNNVGHPTSAPREVIKGWHKRDTQAMGAPVGITMAHDGSVYIAEDKNGTVLRLFYNANLGHGIPAEGLSTAPTVTESSDSLCKSLETRNDIFSKIQREIIDPHCVQCHGASTGNAGQIRLRKCDDIGNALRLLAPRSGTHAIVQPGNLKSEMILRLEGNNPGFPPMPPMGIAEEKQALFRQWVSANAQIPGTTRSKRGTALLKPNVTTKLKLAPIPSDQLTSSQVCDPKPLNQISYSQRESTIDGHSRLFLDKELPNCGSLGRDLYVFNAHFTFQEAQ